MTVKKLKHRCNSSHEAAVAFLEGYDGVEFDLVWSLHTGHKRLIVHHEHGGYGEPFGDFLKELSPKLFMAINVKEYGMAEPLAAILKERGSYFIFDVPGPELNVYSDLGLRVFGRFSELELQKADDYIIDSFESSAETVQEAYDYIVSVEGSSPAALISPTLRGLPEWREELYNKFRYLITK